MVPCPLEREEIFMTEGPADNEFLFRKATPFKEIKTHFTVRHNRIRQRDKLRFVLTEKVTQLKRRHGSMLIAYQSDCRRLFTKGQAQHLFPRLIFKGVDHALSTVTILSRKPSHGAICEPIPRKSRTPPFM